MLAPNEATIREFLSTVLHERGIIHLYRIDPTPDNKNRKQRPVGFITTSIDDAIDWIVKYNKKCNIYYAWNFPSSIQTKKAKEKEILWLAGCHVDIDCPDGLLPDALAKLNWLQVTAEKCRKAIVSAMLPVLIMTGNGIQALWEFDEPIHASAEMVEKVTDLNRRLAALLGGDKCHNVDRVLRLPGTVNWPDTKKLAKGCVPVLAELWGTGNTWTFAELESLPPAPAATSPTPSGKREDPRLHEYTEGFIPLGIAALLQVWPDLEQRLDGKPSHSEALFSFVWYAADALLYLSQGRDDIADYAISKDIRRNIIELMYESGFSFLDHMERNGPGKVGRDIEKALAGYVEAKQGRTKHTLARRVEQNRQRIDRDAKPADARTAVDWRQIFLQFTRKRMRKEDLPNCRMGRDTVAVQQPTTEVNIRYCLERWQITASWDAMREQPDYLCKNEEAPTALREIQRTMPDDQKARGLEALIIDALQDMGLSGRRELSGILQEIARNDRYHPLEDYVTSRPWDGVPRIADVAACLQSANPLKETYLRIFFRACVAAVVSLDRYKVTGDVGEQISSVVVLVGAQGIGKSRLWQALTPTGFRSKGSSLRLGTHRESDAKRECLTGMVCTLNEIGHTFKRSDAEALKDFISQDYDEFRVAYAQHPVSRPRMTVFTGTENALELSDETGSRRFLVLEVSAIDLHALGRIDLQQCFAEAWHEVMEDDRPWWLTAEQDAVREQWNAKHTTEAPECEMVREYLNDVGAQHQYRPVSMHQIRKLFDMDPLNGNKRFANIKRILDQYNIAFHYEYEEQDRKYHKVWLFPVLPEKISLIG